MCENPKTIFVHNQKTAGMSIEKYMFERLSGSKLFLERHAYVEDGINKLGEKAWEEYFSFGFVRNPWSRLVSWYTMIVETPPDKPNKLWNYVHRNSNSFNEFVENCTDELVDVRDGFNYRKSFTRNQFDYFTDSEGEISVDFIGRFENLQEDLDKVLARLGLPRYTLPIVNATKKKDYRTYYDDDTRKIVGIRFKKDIDHFGYTFEN